MVKLDKILNKITYTKVYVSNKDLVINNIIGLKDVKGKDNIITWCNEKGFQDVIKLTNSTIIIYDTVDYELLPTSNNYIFCENPRKEFQTMLKEFFLPEKKMGISNSAFINSTVKLGTNPYIGNNVVIEDNCIIGNNVHIEHNTVIYRNTVIGNNVFIGANNTIGCCGFGYEKDEIGNWELIPHIGNVVIENNVEIGNNNSIDRAVLGSTLLKENSKVDNLVHIAHGVTIGKNSAIIANAMIAGSVVIGDNVWVAPSSSIIQKVTIGDNSLVGLGAVVIRDVVENAVIVGNPAKIINKQNKNI
jgi:UDP-3-O-[3-hydroxymyristoyl] glucosamine N-acyltransferase